jgi:hypothetical protein
MRTNIQYKATPNSCYNLQFMDDQLVKRSSEDTLITSV